MKKLISWAIIVAGTIIFIGCDTDNIDCLRPSTKIISEVRPVSGFNSIISTVVGDISVTQDKDYSFQAEGPENVIEALTLELNNNVLLISSKECFTGNYLLTIDIHLPELESAHLAGVGGLKSMGTLQTDDFSLSMTGVGDIDIDIEADSLNIELVGTGTANLGGIVRKNHLISSGVVQFNGYSLDTRETNIFSTGAGNSYILASEVLDVSIEGTGNVYYKGNAVINSSITGTGKLFNENN